MTKIWLVRHGEAHVNHARDDGLLHVVDEHGLNEAGIAQARRLSERILADPEISPDLVVTSTFTRARQTAEIAAQGLGLSIAADDSIEEWRPGPDATDLRYEEAAAAWARVYAGLDHDKRLSPLSETHNEFTARVDAALRRIATEHSGEEVLVFTHGGVVGRSFVTYMGLPPATALASVYPRHTSLTEWSLIEEFGRPVWRLSRYNDATHLREL